MITKKALLASAVIGFSLLASLPDSKAATLTVNSGDIFLGFYSVNADGISVGANTYIYNLGSGSTYRDTTTSSFDIGSSIGSALTSAFWANWWEPNAGATVRMVLFGGNVNDDYVTTNGDTPKTVYISRTQGSFGAPSSTPPTTSLFTHNDPASYMNDVITGAQVPNTASGGGVQVATSANLDITEYHPPGGVVGYFGLAGVDGATLGSGSIGTGTGGYGVEAQLNAYRIMHPDNFDGGEVLASTGGGLFPSTATGYQGQYVGSFTIDQGGQVRFDTVPEPSTYAMFGLAAVGIGFLVARRRKLEAKA